MPPSEGLLTVAQVAVLLGLSTRTVERMRKDGVIGDLPVGHHRVYITQQQLDTYLRSQARPATPGAKRRPTRPREAKTAPQAKAS